MRQAWLTTCRVRDVQATDDRSHELLWRAISAYDKYALWRLRRLQIIELAVQEPSGKEMPVPGGEPGHICVMTDIQEPSRAAGRRSRSTSR
jgi:hypothetical protein